jgi:ABC-type antimicrobial peptide transport system permease subunit
VYGSPSDDNPWITIVGVTADARRSGADQEVRPGAFLPYQQSASRTVDVLVKTEGDAASLGSAVRAAVAAVDPDLPVRQLRTLESAVGEGLAQRRFLTTLLTAFAAIATLLAAVGTYGVMAYLVGRRTREIGIRVALGAERSWILAAVVREATVQAGVGLALGLFAAWLLGDLLEAQLFAVEPTSPTTLLGSAAVLALVAVTASWLPAWRATRIDPTVALRSE